MLLLFLCLRRHEFLLVLSTSLILFKGAETGHTHVDVQDFVLFPSQTTYSPGGLSHFSFYLDEEDSHIYIFSPECSPRLCTLISSFPTATSDLTLAKRNELPFLSVHSTCLVTRDDATILLVIQA